MLETGIYPRASSLLREPIFMHLNVDITEKVTKIHAKIMEKMTKTPMKIMEKVTNICIYQRFSVPLPKN